MAWFMLGDEIATALTVNLTIRERMKIAASMYSKHGDNVLASEDFRKVRSFTAISKEVLETVEKNLVVNADFLALPYPKMFIENGRFGVLIEADPLDPYMWKVRNFAPFYVSGGYFRTSGSPCASSAGPCTSRTRITTTCESVGQWRRSETASTPRSRVARWPRRR